MPETSDVAFLEMMTTSPKLTALVKSNISNLWIVIPTSMGAKSTKGQSITYVMDYFFLNYDPFILLQSQFIENFIKSHFNSRLNFDFQISRSGKFKQKEMRGFIFIYFSIFSSFKF